MRLNRGSGSKSRLRNVLAGVALFAAVGAASRARAQDAKDLVATLQASDNYKTFAKLLGEANLTSTLQGSAAFTVFAPTDAAFSKMPAGELEKLEKDTVALKKLLMFHIANGALPANKVLNLRNARTLGGSKVNFSVRDARLRVEDVVIVQPDIKASNGLIHGIESVMTPPK